MKKNKKEYSKLFGPNVEKTNEKYSSLFEIENSEIDDKINFSSISEEKEYSDMSDINLFSKELDNSLPKLSDNFEKKLKNNFRELSLIEGNLIDENKFCKAIYCTSCFPKEGKTTTAISMAFGLSQFSGKKVIVVDCNSSNPSLHNLFNINNDIGFQNVLNGEKKLSEVVLKSGYQNLFFITAGIYKRNLNVEKLKRNTEILKQYFDYVILDGYAIYETSEPLNIANCVDGYILTVKCESTKWEIVQMVKDKIVNVGGRVYGVVLNKRKFYISPLIYKIVSKKR
jgi:capsular exopolysaccharide synthesis family protein